MKGRSDRSLPPPDGGDERTPATRLSDAECFALLRGEAVGRVAYVVHGWPVVVPVNFAVIGRDVLFRTDPGGKLTALGSSGQVAFEVDGFDRCHLSGWSVLVHAMASEILSPERERMVAAQPLRSWDAGDKSHWIRLSPLQVTGRRLPRAWRYPDPIPDR